MIDAQQSNNIIMSDNISIHKVFDVSNNMLRKALVVGKTGTGKSSLCNAMAGLPFDAKLFPVSSEATSCTQNTAFANVHFGGDRERLMSIIDTMGFDDPNNDTDVQIIAELIDKLMHNCDKVNLFLIAVNGQNPRFDGSLVAMIKIFQEMFSDAFWKQCCLVFTRMPMDKKSIKKRMRNSDGKTDDDVAHDYIKVVEEKFPEVQAKGLNYVFLDACYDKEDEDEEKAFQNALDKVYKLLESMEGLPTNKINQEVETEHKKLRKELEIREKERQEYMEQLEIIKKQLEQAEVERQENETRYQNEKERLEREIQASLENTERVQGHLEAIQGQLEQAWRDRERDERHFQEMKELYQRQIDNLNEVARSRRGGGCNIL